MITYCFHVAQYDRWVVRLRSTMTWPDCEHGLISIACRATVRLDEVAMAPRTTFLALWQLDNDNSHFHSSITITKLISLRTFCFHSVWLLSKYLYNVLITSYQWRLQRLDENRKTCTSHVPDGLMNMYRIVSINSNDKWRHCVQKLIIHKCYMFIFWIPAHAAYVC